MLSSDESMDNPRVGGVRLSRRELALGAGLAALPLLGMSPAAAAAMPGGTLRERAERKGLLIGAQLDFADIQQSPELRAAAMRDYNSFVSGNGFNWTRLQPQPGAPLNFDQVQPVYDLAKASGAVFRLHDLHYDRTTPAWVKQAVAAGTATQAAKLLETHVRDVLSVWGSRVSQIIVVNEPEYGVGRPFRPDTFGDKMGEAYLDVAFHTARECAPHAVLFINIAGVESVGRRYEAARQGALGLIDRMQHRGVPIDAVGIEGHLNSADPFDPAVYAAFLRQLSSRNLGIMLTEFDVFDTAFAKDPDRRDAQSAQLLEAFLTTSFANPRCMGGCAWSPANRYSWLVTDKSLARPDGLPRRPGLLDMDFHRTPLWAATARALDQAAPRSRAVSAGARSV